MSSMVELVDGKMLEIMGSSLLDNFTNRNYVLLSTHFTPSAFLVSLY